MRKLSRNITWAALILNCIMFIVCAVGYFVFDMDMTVPFAVSIALTVIVFVIADKLKIHSQKKQQSEEKGQNQ